MTADFLDRDTLLRLAEPPRLYVLRWSEEIITETLRNLESRIGLSNAKAAYLAGQLRKHFGDSWVTGYEPLIEWATIQKTVTCLRRP